jgi:DNA-binding beta-propeller fold protein YncE
MRLPHASLGGFHMARKSYICAGTFLVALASSASHPIPASAQAPTYITQWGTQGSGNGEFQDIRGIATDAEGNVYVADPAHNRVQKFGYLPTPTHPTSWGRLKRLFR